MATDRLLAPCLGAALIGGMMVQSCPRPADTARPDRLIFDSGGGEAQIAGAARVLVEPLFWRNNCQFYRVTDEHGVHYAATGYLVGENRSAAISCVITP